MLYRLQSEEVLSEVGFRASIVVFSRLLAELPAAWLMASLFFTMLILMAVNSQVRFLPFVYRHLHMFRSSTWKFSSLLSSTNGPCSARVARQ